VRKILYTDEARRELASAAEWHDVHGSLGADPFLSAMNEVTAEEVRIGGILHTSRDPQHWLARGT
jgi:hypothetical protein